MRIERQVGIIRLTFGLASFIATLVLSACAGAFVAGDERAATQTARAMDAIAAQTLEALRTRADAAAESPPISTATPTALPPTSTPLPSATPWPEPVRVEVSIDTNCRSGPGPNYPMIGALMVGESTIVRARVLDLDYWIVENPDNPGRECWLWNRHATLDGDGGNLPIATPPWTATPVPGSISGWAYIDVNLNLAKDEGDLALTGVVINARRGECPGGLRAGALETDAAGRYQFSDLVPGLYCISREYAEILNPNTWTIFLSPGQMRDEVNFWRAP